MSEQPVTVSAEDSPSWAEVLDHVEHGHTVAVIAHGQHVADVIQPGELERLRQTIDVLSDSELMRDLIDGLSDARTDNVAAELAARRATPE